MYPIFLQEPSSMEESIHREIIAKQDNFIIFKLILKKDVALPPHKSRGLTTLIPIKGQGILMRNTEAIAMRPGINIDLKTDNEHDVLAKTDMEFLVIEIF